MGIKKLRLSRSKLRMEEFDKEAITGFIVGLGLTDATNILKGIDVPFRVAREVLTAYENPTKSKEIG